MNQLDIHGSGFCCSYDQLFEDPKGPDPRTPRQFYLTETNISYTWNRSEDELEILANLIKDRNADIYIHSPLRINPATGTPIMKTTFLNCLKKLLKAGDKLNVKGVVVHTGTYSSVGSEEKALENQIEFFNSILPFASKKCPLLIETPAGEGTDICVKLEEMAEMFNQINPTLHDKVGICIDTCHVFAAGYDPFEYISFWEKTFTVPILLVHFNDSKNPKSSHVDRHAYPGTGHIGEKLQEIHDFCVLKNISMVIE